MNTAISFEGVGLALGGERIYDSVDFTVGESEFVCLLGPSGCGKSTSLRIIGDLLRPDSGRVLVNGRAPAEGWSEIAFVFQSPRLAPWRNALANVLLGVELRFGKAAAKRGTDKARELLALVGLRDSAAKYPLMLSGGERQRVAIARAPARGNRAHLAGDEEDHPVRHPRHRRGADARRPHRSDVEQADAGARRHPHRGATSAQPE